MKITELNIPEEISKEKGLLPVSMSRLGNVVLIAGKNGSGKTRLLELIKDQSIHIPKASNIEQNKKNIFTWEELLKTNKANLKIYNEQKEELVKNGKPFDHVDQVIKQASTGIKNLINAINTAEHLFNWNIITLDGYYENYSFINYVPKELKLDDSAKKNSQQISSSAVKSENFGIEHIARTALSKIQSVCTRYSNATNPSLSKNYTQDETDKAVKDYERLQEYFLTYLGTNIIINIDGLAEIFGFPIGSAKLSDGQIILIQYCVALFNQQAQLDTHVLLLDEPENHMHPEILLNTLDKIVQANNNGQIWIATHSINVLAHFYKKDIWFMENGGISFMGRKPENVLTSLLGNNDEIEKLHQFISMPSIFATNLYAFEALKSPISVLTGNGDPQSIQIFELIF